MIKVYLDEAMQKHETKVKEIMDNKLLHDANFCGADYEILNDDSTWIDNIDPVTGTKLLHQITSLLE